MKTPMLKRILFYTLGLLVMTFGIALTSKANLGVAPVSTISYAVSLLSPLSFGMCSSCFHALCFLTQIAITRRLSVLAVLQIPLVYIFGFLIDWFSAVLRFSSPHFLIGVPLMSVSALIFSLGIRIIIGSGLVLPPPDSLVRLIAEIAGWTTSKSKLLFDTSLVTFSAVFTFFFLGNAFAAVGIGTVICVLLTGPAIGFYQKALPFFDLEDLKNLKDPADPAGS
ncbi:MAG: DUF6198 family protein [Clostridiales bacterium]|nr:DUF6198 family protein [Clostridiales bacterium]